MRYPSATTHQLGPAPHASSPADPDANEARAWFRRHLAWERRLAELRNGPERNHNVPSTIRDRRADTGATR
jgi:hypothetical protein